MIDAVTQNLLHSLHEYVVPDRPRGDPGYYVNVASGRRFSLPIANKMFSKSIAVMLLSCLKRPPGNVSEKESWHVPEFPRGNDPAHFYTPPKEFIPFQTVR